MATPAQRMNGVQIGPNDQTYYCIGAVGDGVTDDTAAIQGAINKAQTAGGGTVELPYSTSLISAPLTLTSTAIHIRGKGMNVSKLKASASMAAVFQFADVAENAFFRFKDFSIDGNSLANYGIISAKIDHSIFYELRVQNTLLAALSMGGGVTGQGYDNDFIRCEIANNSGDGVQLTGQNTNNIVNITECKIFLNSGIGINSTGGAGLNVTGCTIETNLKCGIYLQLQTNSGRITGNYFERNGTTGLVFTSPASKTIKADIIVNGSTVAATMNFSFPCTGLEISGNNSLATAAASGFVYLLAANGVRIENNVLLDTNRALVGTTMQGAGAAKITGLNMSSNVGPSGVALTGTALFNAEDATTTTVQFPVSDWYVDSVVKKNYFNPDPNANTVQILNNSNPFTLVQSATTYNGDFAMEVAAIAGSLDTMGQSFALANYPELANQLVYFACWIQVANAAEGVALFATGPGKNSSSFVNDTNWHLYQVVAQMPASGTVQFGFTKFGATAKAFYARPVVALVGAPYAEFFTGPPTSSFDGPDVKRVGAAIASATTIAPVTAVTHITGTTTIATITPPPAFLQSGKGGKLKFIFDGVAPWSAGGNIFVAGTPTTAGTTVEFEYDNATSKWYPSRLA